MKSRIRTDDHSPGKLLKQRAKFGIRDVSGGGLPTHHLAPFIQHDTEFITDDPARIRLAFLADVLAMREAQLSDRMTELNTLFALLIIGASAYAQSGIYGLQGGALLPTAVPGPRGYDALKNVKSRKRHLLIDTPGLRLIIPNDPSDVIQ